MQICHYVNSLKLLELYNMNLKKRSKLMTSTWKVYLLALVSFLVGTSEYVISGILDKISVSLNISITSAGQLVTIFSLIYAICTPVTMALTAKIERQKYEP